MIRFLHILLFFILSGILNVFSQDTINLMNGKQVVAQKIYEEPNSIIIKYDLLKKSSVVLKSLDRADIFSIHYANKIIKVFYYQDTAFENINSIANMEKFVLGEREAHINYKVPWVTVAGGLVGFVPSATILNFYGLIPPVIYTTAIGSITPKTKVSASIKPEMKEDKYFLDGYRTIATRKKVKNAIISSIGGFIIAVALTNYSNYIKEH